MYLKGCVVFDCYKLKVFNKRRNGKLFTRIYNTVYYQFQKAPALVMRPKCRRGWRIC